MKTKNDSQVRGVYSYPSQLLTAGAALLLSTTLAFGQAVQPASDTSDTKKDDVVKLEKYEVTGSRIKRLDTETVSPVVQMTAASIEAKGFPTFADAVRSLSFNNGQALTPIDAGTSFTPGISTFNFRGLGNNSSLALVNGRRTATYAAPGFNGFQSMFDLNSIPEAAIESIEILKDGGSAIYGSDAVAGVLNIKFRKDYQGAQVSLEYGDYFNTSGAMKSVSFVAGAASGKASIMVAANWRDQGMIMSKDLWYTRNSDLTGVANKAKPQFFLTSGQNPDEVALPRALPYYDNYGDYGYPGMSDYEFYGWFDNSSGSGFPGYATFPRIVDAVPGVSYSGTTTATSTYYDPTANPRLPANSGRNYYNFQDDTSFTDETRNYSFFTRAQYDFTDYLTAALEVSLSHNESTSYSAPTPATLASENSLIQGKKMYVPKENPYNPWGISRTDGGTPTDITSGGRRIIEAGPRVNEVTADSPRLVFMLGGKLPENSFFRDWTWEVGVLYSSSEVSNINRGTVPDYRLQQALMGLVDDGKGGLIWDPAVADPTSATYNPTRLSYFNWFDLNDQRFSDFLAVKNPVTFKSILESYDLRAGGPLAQLPAGPLGFSVGLEHYTQSESVNQTDLNSTGNVIGGSSGSSWDGSRTVDAIYAEVAVPITKWLEASAAGRYESYSDDGFEERVRPKLGIKIRPLDWLIVRASYSQSYKAPDLAYLYASKTVTYTSGQYIDPRTSIKNQLEIHVSGDENLKPETTDTYYAGIAIEPQRGLLKGFGATLDFFHYKQKNLLAQLSDFYSYSDILGHDNVEPFKSMVVRDTSITPSPLLYINDPYINISERVNEGVDFELYYRWSTNRFGSYRVSLEGSYTAKDKVDGDSVIGTPTNRRFRGNAMIAWLFRDWGANLSCYYIRGTEYGVGLIDFDTDTYDTQYRSLGMLYFTYKLKDQYVFNAQVSYKGFWNTQIVLGVTNLFNQRPPVDLSSSTGLVDGVNYVKPAFWSIKVTKQF